MLWKKIFLAGIFFHFSLCADVNPCRAILASPCEGSFLFSTSFLYWQAKIWGLEFASKSFLPNVPGAAAQTLDQKLFVPDFAWRPGVKANLGYNLPYDGWDLSAGYTYYHDEFTSLKKHFDSVISPFGIGVIPLWHYPFREIQGGNTGDPLRYADARANWRLNFNTIDLELGRAFYPIPTLPMRFKIGAKSGWIRQTYHADYENGTKIFALEPLSDLPDFFQFVSSRFQFSSHQWGIGPRIGLESRWNIWREFDLIADGGFSILCSFFNLKTQYRDVTIEFPLGPTTSTMKMDEEFRELTPICEAMLGIDWETCFCEEYFFGITIGYEWQYWWSVNHARRFYVETLPGETFDMRGDLQIQGLNAAVNLDF